MITVEYIRSSAVAAAPMTVGCTFCLAPRGSYCRSTSQYNVPFHQPRKDAIAHLDEQQRYDAYAEMRREEAALRESVSRRLAQPLTAEQRRIRAATGAAWVRAGREATADLNAERERRRPLSPVRGVAPVADLAAERARRRGTSTPRGVA